MEGSGSFLKWAAVIFAWTAVFGLIVRSPAMDHSLVFPLLFVWIAGFLWLTGFIADSRGAANMLALYTFGTFAFFGAFGALSWWLIG